MYETCDIHNYYLLYIAKKRQKSEEAVILLKPNKLIRLALVHVVSPGGLRHVIKHELSGIYTGRRGYKSGY